MTGRARVAVGVALTLVVLAGVAAVVLLAGQEEDHEWRALSEPGGPQPQYWSLLAATEELVVFGPKSNRGRAGKRPSGSNSTLLAMDPAERIRWQVPWVERPVRVGGRWVHSPVTGRLLDLEAGSELELPVDDEGPVFMVGSLLVHRTDEQLRAFDPSSPGEPVWTAPGGSGWRTDFFRFPTLAGFFFDGQATLVTSDGDATTLEISGEVLAASDDAVYLREDETLRCLQIPSGESCGELQGVQLGLVALGAHDGATLWHEAGFDFEMPPMGPPDPRERTRIFAWVPGEDAPRWSTVTPPGSVDRQLHLDDAPRGLLTDADGALPAHACWPIRGELETPTNGYRNVRVVCLDLESGAIVHRAGAGADTVAASHDDEGTILLVENRREKGFYLVRADDRPREAVFLGEGQITRAGPFVWRVDPFGNVRRWDTRSFEPDPEALDRALGPEPALPPTR